MLIEHWRQPELERDALQSRELVYRNSSSLTCASVHKALMPLAYITQSHLDIQCC